MTKPNEPEALDLGQPKKALTNAFIAQALRRCHKVEFPFSERSTFTVAADRLEADAAATAAKDAEIAKLEDALDRALSQICNREARAQEIREWVEEDIGTSWHCDRCGYSTYHQNATECADCGEDMPFAHVIAFKLGATATENVELIESVAEEMALSERATKYAIARAALSEAREAGAKD